MTLRRLKGIIIVTLFILSFNVIGIGCSSNSQSATTVTTTTTLTTASAVTVTQSSVSTITVTQSPLPTVTVTETLSPTTTNTTSTTIPITTTTGWQIAPLTSTPLPLPTVTIPGNKAQLMRDTITLPTYDESSFQQDVNNVKFFPYDNHGIYISTSFSLQPNVYLYLDVVSNTPLDCSKLNIPFNSSSGQGLTTFVNKILNGNYASLTNNFNPLWVYAYEQTGSGNTWETKIILHSADAGIYALYLINTSGQASSVTYSIYSWS